MRGAIALVLATWSLLLGAAATEAALLKGGNFSCVATAAPPAPSSPQLILAGFAGDGGQPAAILKSSDDGASWAPVLPGTATSIAADPLSPGVVYATTLAGLFRSTNYGETWALLNSAIRSWVVVNAGDSAIVYGDNQRSLDGGATWSTMVGLNSFAVPTTSFDRAPHIKVSAADPNFLVALNGGALRSLDGGATWSSIPGTTRSDFYSVDVDPVDARYYYVGYCQHLQRWYPGGTQQVSTSGGDENAIAVDGPSRGRVFTSGQSRSQVSVNHGATWTVFDSVPIGARTGRLIFDPVSRALLVPTASGLHRAVPPTCVDGDGDGYSSGSSACGPIDCNDADPAIHPKAPEVCSDGVDNNCNGSADCADSSCPGTATCPCADADLDGFSPSGNLCGEPDCNDADPAIRPGAYEVCDDTVDNDCSGFADCNELSCFNTASCPCTDLDGDGYSVDGYACGPVDCDDFSTGVHPDAVEAVGDSVDQDCNGYDLTIKVTKATWSRASGLLKVTATSGYADGADLSVQTASTEMNWVPPVQKLAGHWLDALNLPASATMTWVPPAKMSAGHWLGTLTVAANPGTVSVSGFEGSATGAVKSVR